MTTDTDFYKFMRAVDRELMSICGLMSMDLADYPFRDAFDDGVDPHDVAIEMLEEEGYPFQPLN